MPPPARLSFDRLFQPTAFQPADFLRGLPPLTPPTPVERSRRSAPVTPASDSATLTSPPPASTEAALASPESTCNDAVAVELTEIDQGLLADLSQASPALASLSPAIDNLLVALCDAEDLIAATDARLQDLADIDASLRPELLDEASLTASFRALADAARRMQEQGLIICALGDDWQRRVEDSGLLASLDHALAAAAAQLSEIARRFAIAHGGASLPDELQAAVSLRTAIEVLTRADDHLADQELPAEGEPAAAPRLDHDLGRAIAEARHWLSVLQRREREASAAAGSSDPVERLSGAVDRAGQLADGHGGSIPLTEQIAALEQTLEALSLYRAELAERWPRLRGELNRALNRFGISELTTLSRSELVRATSALAGQLHLERFDLPQGDLAYADLCVALNPLLAAAAQTDFGVLQACALVAARAFGVRIADADERGVLPTPEPAPSPSQLQATLNDGLTTLRMLLEFPGTTAELYTMLLELARDPAAASPLRDRLQALAASRPTLDRSDLAHLQTLREERGDLTVEEAVDLARDPSISLAIREALWPLVNTPGGRTALGAGLNAESLMRLRTEVALFGSDPTPIGCYHERAATVAQQLANALQTGITADRLGVILAGLSPAQIAYVIARHDCTFSPPFAQRLSETLVGAELGEAVSSIEQGAPNSADATAIARLLRDPATASTRAERMADDLQRSFTAYSDVPFFVRLNQAHVTAARTAIVEAQQRTTTLATALAGGDEAQIQQAREEFAAALAEARRLEHRVARESRYALDQAEGRAMALRDLGAATAVFTTAMVVTGGVGATLLAESGVGFFAISLSAGAGIAAGTAAYTPVALMDQVTGDSEFSHFHLREAFLTATLASLGTSFGAAGLASVSSPGVTLSMTTRMFVSGLSLADATLATGAIDVLTTPDFDRALARLDTVPEETAHAFVFGAVLGALRLPNNGLAAHGAYAGIGAADHLVYQALTHRDLTDGLGEAVVQSVAVGSIAQVHSLSARAAASPRLRPGRSVRIDGSSGVWRIRRVFPSLDVVVARAGESRTVPLWEIAVRNPDLLVRPRIRPTPTVTETGPYRSAAGSTPPPVVDYHHGVPVTRALVHALGVEWCRPEPLTPRSPSVPTPDAGFNLRLRVVGDRAVIEIIGSDGELVAELTNNASANGMQVSWSTDGRYLHTGGGEYFDFGATIEDAAAHAHD